MVVFFHFWLLADNYRQWQLFPITVRAVLAFNFFTKNQFRFKTVVECDAAIYINFPQAFSVGTVYQKIKIKNEHTSVFTFSSSATTSLVRGHGR